MCRYANPWLRPRLRRRPRLQPRPRPCVVVRIFGYELRVTINRAVVNYL